MPIRYQTYKKNVRTPSGFTLGFTPDRGYYAKPTRPSIAPRGMPTPSTPDPYAPLTNAQMEEQARKRSQDTVDTQTRAIQALQDAYDRQQEQRRQAYVQLSGAAAEMAGRLGPAGQAAFNSGARELSDLAAPLSEDVRANLMQSETGNRQFVEGQVPGADPSKAPNADNLKDVIYGTGAAIPGTSLIEQGSAFAQWGAKQPGIMVGYGIEQLRVLDAQIEDKDAEYRDQIRQVIDRFPELRDQALEDLKKWEIDKANYKLSLRQQAVQERAQKLYEKQFGEKTKQQGVSNKQAQARIDISRRNADASERRLQQQIKEAEKKGHKVDASASRLLQHLVDVYGRPILDANGKLIPVTATSSGNPKSRDNRSKALTQASQDAYKSASDLRGDPIENKSQGPLAKGAYIAAPGAKGSDVYAGKAGLPKTTNNPSKAARDSNLSFAQALDQVYGAVGGDQLAAQYGISKSQIRQLIRQQMIRAGWKPDGRRPRR